MATSGSSLPSSSSNKPHVVVGLDLNILNDEKENFKYKRLSAREKINLIRDAIIVICENLKKQELNGKLAHNSMWIIGWQEWGITEYQSKFLTSESKSLFKKVMEQLVSQYKQLTIIAGTVASQRDISKDKFEKYSALIKKRIDDLKEKGFHSTENITEKLQELKAAADNGPAYMVRNTCFVFSFPSQTKKRSKAVSCFDTQDHIALEPELKLNANAVFYPGKHTNFVFDLSYPDGVTKLNVGVEICYEHKVGALKSVYKDPVDLHLIISDFVKDNPRYFHGVHAIQFDSRAPFFHVVRKDLNKFTLDLYRYDLIKAVDSLQSVEMELIKPTSVYKRMLILNPYMDPSLVAELAEENPPIVQESAPSASATIEPVVAAEPSSVAEVPVDEKPMFSRKFNRIAMACINGNNDVINNPSFIEKLSEDLEVSNNKRLLLECALRGGHYQTVKELLLDGISYYPLTDENEEYKKIKKHAEEFLSYQTVKPSKSDRDHLALLESALLKWLHGDSSELFDVDGEIARSFVINKEMARFMDEVAAEIETDAEEEMTKNNNDLLSIKDIDINRVSDDEDEISENDILSDDDVDKRPQSPSDEIDDKKYTITGLWKKSAPQLEEEDSDKPFLVTPKKHKPTVG